jgi:membrane associated rhomboid family serine protease
LKQSLNIIIGFVLLIWLSFFLSLVFPIQQFGLIPRTIPGLLGIISAPFLHGSLSHLIGNSISFTIFALVLSMLEGNKMFAKVMLMILIGGGLTWILGRNAIHIGASGLIFSLWGYMLFAGWFSRKLKYILVSFGLIFFYSGMIFGVLPGKVGISWEGHLFGFIAGIIVSWLYHRKIGTKKRVRNSFGN